MNLELEQWPPSANRLYTVVRGRKILSTEGRAYKKYVHFAVAQAMPERLGGNTKLKITYCLYSENWLNKGYPDKAKSKFKKIDLTNVLKCLEDALCEALGIDDSQFFIIEVNKCQGKKKIVLDLQQI